MGVTSYQTSTPSTKLFYYTNVFFVGYLSETRFIFTNFMITDILIFRYNFLLKFSESNGISMCLLKLVAGWKATYTKNKNIPLNRVIKKAH